MRFLLQTDDFSVVEKRVVRVAAMLSDAELHFASMGSLLHGEMSPDIPVDATPVGSVEFVLGVMSARGIAHPEHMTYPECLKSHLHRTVWGGRFDEATDNVFVKPRYAIKGFTGALRNDLENPKTIPVDYPVWFSDKVKFAAEWRYYIVRDKIVGAGRYDDGEDESLEPNIKQVETAVIAMKKAGAPAGYALDFGVLDNGKTALVEANDGWALGYYRGSCSHSDYAELLRARWLELLALAG